MPRIRSTGKLGHWLCVRNVKQSSCHTVVPLATGYALLITNVSSFVITNVPLDIHLADLMMSWREHFLPIKLGGIKLEYYILYNQTELDRAMVQALQQLLWK